MYVGRRRKHFDQPTPSVIARAYSATAAIATMSTNSGRADDPGDEPDRAHPAEREREPLVLLGRG